MVKINLRHTSSDICELFEELLDKYDINIPDENREGDPDEAHLYGDNYVDLEDSITEIILNLANQIKKENIEFETETYNFTEIINEVYYLDEKEN